MEFGGWFNMLPLWAVFVLTLALCVASVEAGAALAAMALRRKNEKDPEAPLGSLVGAVLGLLGFILAFTFGMTGSRFDARRQLVLEEANALGTTYRRAGLLPQAQGAEVRRLLREYADVRLKVTRATIDEAMQRSAEIHGRLWSQAESLAGVEMDSELRSLFVAALGQLIELHESRKTVGMHYQIPGMVWLAVYLLSVLSMLSVGYYIGMSGMRRLRGTSVLAAAFSLVILLIADLDRPGEGMLRVSQQPIADVQQMMSNGSP